MTQKMKQIIVMLFVSAAVIASPLTALAVPMTLPDGTIFDPEYYAQQNPDVAEALGTDAALLYQHYISFGKNEGRLPNASAAASNSAANADGTITLPDGTIFDPIYYVQSNPDVAAVLGTDANLLAQHYLQFGKAEGRKPAGSASNSSNGLSIECKTAEQRIQDHDMYVDYVERTHSHDGNRTIGVSDEEMENEKRLYYLAEYAYDLESAGLSEAEHLNWCNTLVAELRDRGWNAHIKEIDAHYGRLRVEAEYAGFTIRFHSLISYYGAGYNVLVDGDKLPLYYHNGEPQHEIFHLGAMRDFNDRAFYRGLLSEIEAVERGEKSGASVKEYMRAM